MEQQSLARQERKSSLRSALGLLGKFPSAKLLYSIVFALSATLESRAAGLLASDGKQGDRFGDSASVSGNTALVIASHHDLPHTDSWDGAAYLFRQLDTATGTVTQSAKLIIGVDPYNSYGSPHLENAVSLDGNIALCGAWGAGTRSGAVYLYRNLDTAVGTKTEDAHLLPKNPDIDEDFGFSVSLSGTTALISSIGEGELGDRIGNAYVFRNLDAASGIVHETIELTATDIASDDGGYGISVSLSQGTGLVGAPYHQTSFGSAYLYRNLDTIPPAGPITENAKLIASTRATFDHFGYSVSISGTNALIGAPSGGSSPTPGAAYVFRNLHTATGPVTEHLKLIASDGNSNDRFGAAVSLSGSNGIVSSPLDDDQSGSACLFRNLTTATGTIVESVEVYASDWEAEDEFGHSVSIDGDLFVVGAKLKNGLGDEDNDGTPDQGVGKAYSGSLSSMTVLNAGNTSRNISQLSFVSQEDWIIGQTTDGNHVRQFAGDEAYVNAPGKAVYIGQNAGSDGNSLVIGGHLESNEVYIGALAGNAFNTLKFENGASFNALLRLAPGSALVVPGDRRSSSALLTYLNTVPLQVWSGGAWTTINAENHGQLTESSYSGGYTTIATELVPVSVVSRKTHGGITDFDVLMPFIGAPGVEPRRGSGATSDNHRLVATFAAPVTFTSAQVTSGIGSISAATVNGNDVVIDLTGVANAQQLTVTLFNVSNGASSNDIALPARFLVGDTSGDSNVNAGDALQTRNRTGQPLSTANFRSDVNVDGSINSGDATVVKNRSGTFVP